jgi:hypothetical protein
VTNSINSLQQLMETGRGKKSICRLLKKTQRRGARRPMSGGVLFLYVDARSVERNEAYEAFSAVCQLVAGPAYQRTNADDAKKQLVDGNLVRRSHLAKRAREQQVEEEPAEAGKSEKAEQTIAEQRR